MCPYYLDGDLGKSLAAPPGDTRVIGYCAVFKVREEVQLGAMTRDRNPRAPAPSRSLKTQQHTCNRLAPIALGEIHPNATMSPPWRVDFSRRYRHKAVPPGPVDMLGRPLEAIAAHIGLPRKEVIQPQLPLRLPCYDFTPVASPTFDGTLLKG